LGRSHLFGFKTGPSTIVAPDGSIRSPLRSTSLGGQLIYTLCPVGRRFRILADERDREGGKPFVYSHFDWPFEVGPHGDLR
jgi:hypothetical protein